MAPGSETLVVTAAPSARAFFLMGACSLTCLYKGSPFLLPFCLPQREVPVESEQEGVQK